MKKRRLKSYNKSQGKRGVINTVRYLRRLGSGPKAANK